MSDLSLYINTFNCGRALISTDFFAAHLFAGLTSTLPPDLIVLSLQEIAPLGPSFLGGSLLTPYFSRFASAVFGAVAAKFDSADNDYVHVATRNVGMTALMLFARSSVQERVHWIETAGVGVGLWQMGNKGVVGLRLGLECEGRGEEDVLTFVAAHLAPMEEAWERRNEDWRSMCEGLVFERDERSSKGRGSRNGFEGSDGDDSEPLLSATLPSTTHSNARGSSSSASTLFTPASHLFLAGDLNYRTSDQRADPTSSSSRSTWPQPVSSPSDPRHYSQWFARDQLTRESRKHHTLHHLTEASVTFPPTYKYSVAAQRQATTQPNSKDNAPTPDGSAEFTGPIHLWAGHRTPSWCDRVLFLSSATPPTVHAYISLPVQPTSDHRPVVLSCSLPSKVQGPQVEAPFAIRKDWRERRAAARRLELLVGVAAYLAMTWEGEMLLAGTVFGVVGGYLVLRVLVG